MDLTNADVADILALLDSLPYDELDLETSRFRLTLRRTPAGWTQSTQVLSEPDPLSPAPSGPKPTTVMSHRGGYSHVDVTSVLPSEGAERGDGEADGTSRAEEVAGEDEAEVAGEDEAEVGGEDEAEVGGEDEAEVGGEDGAEVAGEGSEGLVAVRAPLPGTFYRAPRPGAAPFAEVGSRVGADTVIGIVETMKLMNPVHAGVAGVVAEFCVGNAEFAAHGATLLRIRTD